MLFSWLEKLEKHRELVIKRMRELEVASVEHLSQEAADCHLRPLETRRKKDRCQLCMVHDQIEDYESVLFRMANRKNSQEEEWDEVEEDTPAVLETLRRGTWADSEAERALRHMLAFARKHNNAPQLVRDGGTVHLLLLDACKKEFPKVRIVWRQLSDQASAVDELSMAILRLRLRLPHELPQPKPSLNLLKDTASNPNEALPIYLLEPHDVDIQFAKLQGDLVSASNELKRHMGQVLYLKNLEMAGFGKECKQNPDPCPICLGKLGDKWSVLSCGHSFCMQCVDQLIQQSNGIGCVQLNYSDFLF